MKLTNERRKLSRILTCLVCAVALLCLGTLAVAQNAVDGSGPDPRVRELPRELARNPGAQLTKLARYFASLSSDPFEQIKLIHDWITDTIAYDTVAFFAGDVSARQPAETVNQGKAVCQGYAELFSTMAEAAGFSAPVISGYGRGYGFDPFSDESFGASNHAWNAVEIAGEWYLIDCTWDAGYVNGRDYVKKYSTEYLFIDPAHMIFTHYPDDPEWQLLDPPVKPDAVARWPQYRGIWFYYGLEPVSELSKVIQCDGDFVYRLPVPDGVSMTAHLYSSSGTHHPGRVLIQKRDGAGEIRGVVPSSGRYLLRIFARDNQEGEFGLILEIGVESTGGERYTFPLLYNTFFSSNCYLISPIDRPVSKGDSIDFKIVLPGYNEAFLDAGSDRIPLAGGDGDVFSATVEIPAVAEITVFARTAATGQYAGIMKFEVLD